MSFKVSRWILKLFTMVFVFFPAFFVTPDLAKGKTTDRILPYRALLLADHSLKKNDPAGQILYEGGMSQDIAALLKGWSIPFDIFLINEKTLDKSILFTPKGEPRYGVIIWTVKQKISGNPIKKVEMERIKKTLEQGTGILDPGNFLPGFPSLWKFIGLKKNEITGKFEIRLKRPVEMGNHFITREIRQEYFRKTVFHYNSLLSFATGDQIISNWGQPVVVAHESSKTKGVFISPPNKYSYHKNPAFAHILRRSIIWICGYGLYKIYPSTVALRMDDPGASVPFYLKKWSFASLTREEWSEAVLTPLERRGAMADIFMIPAVPVPGEKNEDQEFIKSWTLPDFEDRFGKRQSFGEMWSVIGEGVEKGLLAFQSHGWSHLNPDMPMWRKASNRFTSSAWWKEFYDIPKMSPVQRATQLKHLKNSRTWLKEYFGEAPLVFGPGGDAYSKDIKKGLFTYQLAGETGFGLAQDVKNFFYLEGRRVIQFRMSKTFNLQDDPELPLFMLPVPLRWHDRDYRVYGMDFLEKHLRNVEKKAGNKIEYISLDDFCGTMHTDIQAKGGDGIEFRLTPHPFFSRNLLRKKSKWYFTALPELLRERHSDKPMFSLNGKDLSAKKLNESTYLLETPPLSVSENILKVH